MRVLFRFAPEQAIATAGLMAVASTVAMLWLAVQAPSLGLVWRAEGETLRIQPGGPNTTVPPGTEIAAIRVQGRSYRLRATDVTPEPDVTFDEFDDYRAFVARQDRISEALSRSAPVTLVAADGRSFSLLPRTHRPLAELPWQFWLQLVCGVGGLLAGATVWAYRQTDPAAAYYLLTGVGLAAAAMSAAVYSTRELALPGSVFETLRVINQSGTLLYTAGFVSVLWYYPARLGRFPLGPCLLAAYVAFALMAWRHWLPSIDLAVRWPVLTGFAGAVVLGVIQWRASVGKPLARAGLRWFLFSWFFGSALFLALVFLPPLFGVDSAAAAQGPAFLLLLVIHLALAVGILRYRLFELDRWWGRAWLLAASGLLIYGVDFLLIHVIGLAGVIALPVSLALIGWLYFPARQWIVGRLSRVGRRRPPALVRRVTDALSEAERAPGTAWPVLLNDIFQPGEVSRTASADRDRIDEGGLTMVVAGAGDHGPLTLRYCQNGARLFRRDDLALLRDLRALFGELSRYRDRLRDAVAAERRRVARDLHDDVGARLLTLVGRLDEPYVDEVRAALTELRSVVYSMRPADVAVADAMGDWRGEIAERCDAARVVLDWRVHGEPPDLYLSGGTLLALTRVMRESVTNALRHAAPERLMVEIRFERTRMDCVLSHGYEGASPETWRASLGLHNLRERMAREGGEIQWRQSGAGLETHWTLDLAPSAGGYGAAL